ncbi:MAG: AMP-binding protein [Pseudomonadota bacterium]
MEPVRYTEKMRKDYVSAGYWGNPMPSELWDRNAIDYPDREAIVDTRNRFTWGQAKKLIDHIALAMLEMGFKKDDIVLLQLPNISEFLILRIALEKAGIISLGIQMFFRHEEIKYVLKATNAKGMFIVRDFHNFNYENMISELRSNLPSLKHIFIVREGGSEETISLNKLVEQPLQGKFNLSDLEKVRIRPLEVYVLLMTSGTTGFPKLIEMTWDSFYHLAKTCVERFEFTKEDVIASFAPISGGPGAVPCWFAAPQSASKVVMLESWNTEEALKLLEREKATIAGAVPAQLIQLIKHPEFHKYDLSNLRAVTYAGATIPYEIAADFEKKTGAKILTFLGSVDGGTLTTTSTDSTPKVRWQSVGKPIAGVEVKLVDEQGLDVSEGEIGEIVWRGPTGYPGLFQDNKSTLEMWGGSPDGWFQTGDLGKFDEEGNLYVSGRKKDVIIRGGQNIIPSEIEGLLATHPKVLDIAVVAMPDRVMGEKACAFVIPRPGQEFTFEEMSNFLKEKKIAMYKIPERLEILSEFPTTADGQKIVKRELTERVTKKLEEEGKL